MARAIDDAVKEQVRAARRQTYRHAILTAAEALFAERGFASIAMADIASAAGIAKGTLYNYFDSKEEVFAQLAERARQAYLTEIDNAMKGRQGWDCLQSIATTVVTFLGRDPSKLSMYLDATGDGATRSQADPGRDQGQLEFAERIRTTVVALYDSGDLRKDLDPDRLALTYCGALEAQVRANLTAPSQTDFGAQVEHLITLLRHGAQA